MQTWGRRLCVLLLVLGIPLKSLAAAGVLACALMGHLHGPAWNAPEVAHNGAGVHFAAHVDLHADCHGHSETAAAASHAADDGNGGNDGDHSSCGKCAPCCAAAAAAAPGGLMVTALNWPVDHSAPATSLDDGIVVDVPHPPPR